MEKSKTNSQTKYFGAIGRRKASRALIKLFPNGKGDITVNKKDYKEYFPLFEFQREIIAPFRAIGQEGKLDCDIRTTGGGVRGQAESILLGISRALVKLNPIYRKTLKKLGYLTRDARIVERKKTGLKSARVREQWRKR